MAVAVFPGTFDPVTNGHLDLIRRSAHLFDKVIIAIFNNMSKNPMFTVEERWELLAQVTADLDNVEIDSFRRTLLVTYAREHGATVLVRGVRTIADFEYEVQMTQMNRHLDDGIETVYLTPRVEYACVSSSLIKEVAILGGDVAQLVPPPALQALKEKLQSQS